MSLPPLANNWCLGNRPELGAMNVVNQLVRALDVAQPEALPRLREPQRLIVASDYGGQHASSQFEALAFLIADAGRLGAWLDARQRFRENWLPDVRRMSFKSLNDRLRANALPGFLELADQVHGLLFVVLVDKQVGTLFNESGEEPSELETRLNASWQPKTIEKALRICHFLSLMLAGLTREFQDVLWITDQDDVAANTQRHHELVQVFGNVASHYLEHTLGHLRVATTHSDTGKRDLEDLVSIPDLAAGAICQVLNESRSAGLFPVQGVISLMAGDASTKVQRLMNWFSDRRSNLKRLVISIEPIVNTPKLSIKHLDFVGSSSLRWPRP
jgi:hypothetical protein